MTDRKPVSLRHFGLAREESLRKSHFQTSLIAALSDPKHRLVSAGFIVSIVVVVSVFGLQAVPEQFGFGSELGSLASGLATSFIAAWTFFYLSVWRPQQQVASHQVPESARTATAIAGQARGFLWALSRCGRERTYDFISREALVKLVEKSYPAGYEPQGRQPHLDLIEGADRMRWNTSQLIGRVERWRPLVDPELLRLIYEIADTEFVRQQGHCGNFQGSSGQVLIWIEACDRLGRWVNAEYGPEIATWGPILIESGKGAATDTLGVYGPTPADLTPRSLVKDALK